MKNLPLFENLSWDLEIPILLIIFVFTKGGFQTDAMSSLSDRLKFSSPWFDW